MILKKPYAFFIKMFKPIHLILSVLIAYLIYLNNKILVFLNNYITSTTATIEENVKALVSNFLFIIPIVIIIFSLIILGIMFKKKKPIKFYFINVFAFIVVIIINLYASNFLNVIHGSAVSVKTVKLIHDLVLINIGIESISFIFFVIRGMGVNFKKFDFDSDISKINISESDKEEFEVNVEVDLDETKRKRKKKLRYLKYFYVENKFLINIGVIIGIVVIFILSYFIYQGINKTNKEGVVYSTSKFSFQVSNTTILNTDYRGNELNGVYLLVVNTKLRSNNSNINLSLKNFSLRIEGVVFKPTNKYSNYVADLGNIYNEENLTTEFKDYLFVFEVPIKYIESNFDFNYSDEGNNISIRLKPTNLVSNQVSQSKNITEEMSFEETLGDIKFKINNYDIKNKYLISYEYCVKDNDCLLSYEYLTPSIDKNFDKTIMRLNVDYTINSELNINNFYSLFSEFGSISYKIGDTWYSQNASFEEIKSSKISSKNDVYIGVNSNILNASSIKIVFNIRGSKYEYLLK